MEFKYFLTVVHVLDKMKTINMVVLMLFGLLAMVCNQVIKGPLVVYQVSKIEGCLSKDKSFLSLVITSINQCAEECFLRPQCMAIEYEQRFQICELLEFARTETVPRREQKEACVYLRKSEMTVRNQLPSVCNYCVRGETCNLELLQCVKKECKRLNVINGDVLGNMNSNGSRVKYTCHPGFTRAHIEGFATCIDGIWQPIPACLMESKATIGKTCSHDSECLETEAQCISSNAGAAGKCFCNRLYRYNSTSRNCEKVCAAIQDNFIKYEKQYIKDYNSIAFRLQRSFDECRRRCVVNVECMNFEWNANETICHMGNVTVEMIIDADPSALTKGKILDLYSRSCQ